MTINIAEFEAVLPDAEVIRTAAGAFKDTVGSINTTATVTASTWTRLEGGVYDVPGKEQVFSAFVPVLTASGDLVENAATVHTATTAYAEAVDALKVRLEGVKADTASFYREVDGRPQDEWDDDEGLVEKELAIIGALDQLFADLQAAQRDCANAISGIYGGPSYVQTTEEGVTANQVAYGYSSDQLDAAAAAGDIPWGKPTEWDKPWYRDVGDSIASFGKGLWSGVTGTVTGLGNMVGLNGAEAFKQTWAGIGKLAVNVAIVTSPVLQMSLRATGNGDVADRAGEELLAVGKAAIHWDEWQSDPAYAAGATTFDLAAILMTAGAGATAKVGSVAGKIGTIGGKAGTVVKVTGIGKVAVGTVKATDFIQGVKVSTITITADVGRTVIAKVDDVYRAGTAGVGNTVRNGVAVMNDAGDRIVNALSPQPVLAGAGGVPTRPGALLNAVETHAGSQGGGSGAGQAPTGRGSGSGSTLGSSASSSSPNLSEEIRRRNEGRFGQTVDEQPTPVRTNIDPAPDERTGAAETSRSSTPEAPERTQPEAPDGTGTSAATPGTADAPDQAGMAGRSAGAAIPDRPEAPERTRDRSDGTDEKNIGNAGWAPENSDIPSKTGGEQRESAAVEAPEGPSAGRDKMADGENPSDTNPRSMHDEDQTGSDNEPAGNNTAGTAGDHPTSEPVPVRDDVDESTSHSTLSETWDNSSPKVEFDEAGNPVKLIFSDGEHRVAFSNDHLGNGARDIMEHIVPALERHGRDMEWLKDIVKREASESLSVADMQALFDVRRSIPDLTGDSVMQKVLNHSSGDFVLSNVPDWRGTVLGFVTDGADARELLTPSEIFRALRLDYENTGFRNDDSLPVRAIRFSSTNAFEALIPDESLVQNLQRNGVDVPQEILAERPPASREGDSYPNTGHGFTASAFDRKPIMVEYKASDPMKMRKGAEMWELTGDRVPVLVGIFDGANWRRIDINAPTASS
ncbi:hypothetical protein C4K88_07545 [Arthrobacter pityocampae]|uniref:Uncharacterized protein n=1 Tax=Arthrobacter pityocampae TaxID=547334 RepID=A0A2S5IY63_9MICC|nr:hypothetical protein [Arthrobacter pityocampae]PPB49536.1 hypothetical protein C4K88_07545 [Arthrobacter pityocampae]